SSSPPGRRRPGTAAAPPSSTGAATPPCSIRPCSARRLRLSCVNGGRAQPVNAQKPGAWCPSAPPAGAAGVCSLVVEDLVERVLHLDQVGLVGHHLVHV